MMCVYNNDVVASDGWVCRHKEKMKDRRFCWCVTTTREENDKDVVM